MLVQLLIQEGITPIMTVRKENQAQLLRELVGEKYA